MPQQKGAEKSLKDFFSKRYARTVVWGAPRPTQPLLCLMRLHTAIEMGKALQQFELLQASIMLRSVTDAIAMGK
ncbi:hypothetical protein [Vacuolonema iberomarrocanum]|uniref:hypothetical protein n=1 Tax=Vacuolonema iberomarrocanum TaxID=3454632 RepID=UPI0019DC931C|nr:hypothetical protein [filamentous cyanobacterium LEGE 07170]